VACLRCGAPVAVPLVCSAVSEHGVTVRETSQVHVSEMVREAVQRLTQSQKKKKKKKKNKKQKTKQRQK